MQYYKFPDYSPYGNSSDWARMWSFWDEAICSKGSMLSIQLSSPNPISGFELRLNQITIENGTIGAKSYNVYAGGPGGYTICPRLVSRGCVDYDGSPSALYGGYLIKKGQVKIIQYKNNKPSAFAVLAMDRSRAENSGDWTGSILFYAINATDDPESEQNYINQLDIEFKELGFMPTNTFVDTDTGLMYISYTPAPNSGNLNDKIVILDCSDLNNIQKVSEFNDSLTIKHIKQFTVDTSLSLIFCLTEEQSNTTRFHNKIAVLYHDNQISNAISKRSEYIAATTDSVNYNSIVVKDNYIYTTNINSFDYYVDTDIHRSNVGLHILKTNDNFVTISKVKSVPFGHYWNDIEIPLDKTDIGYKSRHQSMHYSITLHNDIIYVLNVGLKRLQCSNSLDPIYEIEPDQSSMIMYNIFNSENPSPIGSTTLHFDSNKSDMLTQPTFEDYEVVVLQEDNTTGNKYILERAISNAGGAVISKIINIDTSDVSLLQEINFQNDIAYDVDYINEDIIAIANGSVGVEVRYFNQNNNQYDILTTLRPQDQDTNTYDAIEKVIMYGDTTNMSLFCFGKLRIYNYRFDSANFNFVFKESYKLSDFGIANTVLQNRMASYVSSSETLGALNDLLYFYPKVSSTELSFNILPVSTKYE
jgi:hypothetical protein